MLRRSSVLLCCCLCATLLLGACLPKATIKSTQTPPVAPVVTQPTTQTLADKAAEAWARGDMMESERLYGLALRDPSTPAALRHQAWERLASAAVTNRHAHSALEILEAWRGEIPGADNAPIWMTLWEQAATQLPPEDIARRATLLWRDPLRPAMVRFGAAKRALTSGDPLLAEALTGAYSQSDAPARGGMERELLQALAPLPDATLVSLVGAQPGPDTQYPWSIFLLEYARRNAANVPAAAPGASGEQAQTDAAQTLDALLARIAAIKFADAAVVGVLNQAAATAGQDIPAISLPMPSIQELVSGTVNYQPVCTAMLLPLSGPYAGIAGSIQAGAAAAQQQMRQAGVNIDVQFIDTQAPDWLQRLTQLPAACTVVGGPMQPDIYATVKAQNLPGTRAVFAFLGRIDEGDEGVTAWRFFPSRDDQLTTMLRFAQQLGIHQFGIFAPEDGYGNAMSNEFQALASRFGGTVSGSAFYPPDAPEQWTKLAGQFVGVRVVNKVPIPSSSFRAIFLPDSWNSMDMVISSLFYQGEDSQLLMGTSLWEQTLLENPPAMLTNMQFAAFPGMWNPRSLEVPARLLQAGLGGRKVDTWAALGYDFVRFASALGLRPGWTASDVNARLEQAQRMSWSMAPLHWQNGRAAQQMFVLSPAKDAPSLVDTAVFKQRLDDARARSERRAARATGKK